VEWSRVNGVCVCIYNVFSDFLSIMGQSVLYESAFLVLMVTC
jgi:hypothetical protein